MNAYFRSLCLNALLGFSASVAAQAPAGSPTPLIKEGTTVKISQHVYVIPDAHVPMVPNVGMIVGSKATLVVDPGMGMRGGQSVMRELAKVSRNTEIYIVNTHFHPEHTTGEMAFPSSAKIVRAAAQQQDVDEMGMKWVENFASRTADLAEILKGVSFRAPTEIFEREKMIDLGGVRVRLLRLGPGHTRGDTVAFVEGDGVLFSGDLAMRRIFPAFATPQSKGASWLTSLDELDRFRANHVVPAHGDVTDASVIDAYRGYLQALQARVNELKAQGKTAKETAAQAGSELAQKYPDWAQPARIQAAAMVIYFEQP